MWNEISDYMQYKWDTTVLDIIGIDPFHHYVTSTIILANSIYLIFGGALTIMNVTKKPQFIQKYRIQPTEPVDGTKIKKVIINVLFNQLIIGGSTTYLTYYLTKTSTPPSTKLPTLSTIILSIIVFLFIREVGIYYVHRLLHTKYFYKSIHKTHHEWTSPISIQASYVHPFEYFINGIPVALGPVLFQAHILTVWIWIICYQVENLSSHSGYHLPLMYSPEFHDFHHLKFNQNYGVLGMMDWLHKTDTEFRKHIAYKRDYWLLNTTPVSETIPDIPKKTE